MKFVYIFLGLLINSALSYGQNRSELLQYADDAFERKEYITAAYYYGKVIGSFESAKEDLVYPYQFSPWNKPLKKEKKSDGDSSVTSADSANAEKLPPEPGNQQPATSNQEPDTTEEDKEEKTDSTSSDKKLVAGKAIDSTAFKENKSYQYALYRLAESYQYSFNYEKAEAVWKQTLTNDPSAYPFTRFWYALSIKKNMKYELALEHFGEFLDAMDPYENDSVIAVYLARARRESSGCVYSLQLINNAREGVDVRLADSLFNQGTSNFSANYYGTDNFIIFASARAESERNKNAQNGEWYCDFFTMMQDEEGKWSKPENFGTPVNSSFHEAGVAIAPDMENLYFTRWGDSKDPNSAIYISKYYNNSWLMPMKLNEQINVPGYNTMHPSVSTEEDILFFASDRPGGYGKMDIWYCIIDKFGNVTKVENLGPYINTEENEVSPFYHSEGRVLYFSSDGHYGMGGLDIFKSEGSIDNFSEPENLGYPVNSGREDLYFILNKDQEKGFLTSDRDDCKECPGGGSCYKIYEMDYIPIRFTLSGYVRSKLTGQPISTSLVGIQDVDGNLEPTFAITNDSGYYKTQLRANLAYFLKAQKVRYFAASGSASTIGLSKSTDLKYDFLLDNIPVGDIRIAGIYYDYDKWDLRPESKLILDSLMYFLTLNDNLVIELSSHTDDRGEEDYNLELSQKRAQSVVDYLVEKGMETERLAPVGYGERVPIVPGALTEEDHQLNRRTAYKVLSEEFKTKKKKKFH